MTWMKHDISLLSRNMTFASPIFYGFAEENLFGDLQGRVD
jgi:hypothetical protein